MNTKPCITLVTLPQATAQEVFDQVKEHLLTQKVQSKTSFGCAYRGDGGLMCAAGCLIGEGEYVPHMDNEYDSAWSTLVSEGVVPKDHQTLIQSLQNIHDGSPDDWVDELKELADTLNLKY